MAPNDPPPTKEDESEIDLDFVMKVFASLDPETREQILNHVRDGQKTLNLRRIFVFRRPDKGFAGLLSRALPPLPTPTKAPFHPTKGTLALIPSFRLKAFGLIALAISALLALMHFVPWMRTSPTTIIVNQCNSWFGERWGGLLSMAVIVALLMLVGKTGGTVISDYSGKFWDKAAMLEEQWFRMGAENWTTGQRAYSVVAFGLVHVMNIIYPIGSLIVVTLVGWVFLAVYLRAYKKTGSTELATVTSAKLHATYNRFSILYIVVAVGAMIAWSIVSS